MKEDCFYQKVLKNMNQTVLDSYFGWMFMKEPRWFVNWAYLLEYEKDTMYQRESYILGVWMNSEH